MVGCLLTPAPIYTIMNLEREDLLGVGSITHRNTLVLLPKERRQLRQKLVIGDDSGAVMCYQFRKGEPTLIFQSQAFDEPITCTTVALDKSGKDDSNIYVSQGQKVVGLSRKGKEISKLISALAEPIFNIAVDEKKMIYTGCEYIYTSYENGKDVSFFMSNDLILCLLIDTISMNSNGAMETFLGCKDNCVRVISESDCIITFQTTSAVTALETINTENSSFLQMKDSKKQAIYGLDDGDVGLFEIDRKTFETNLLWTLGDYKRVSVSCLRYTNVLSASPTPSTNPCKDEQLVVCRQDGRFEVFSFDNKAEEHTPNIVSSKDVNESIKSVAVGFINSDFYAAIVIATFSGKILSFTTEPISQRAQDDSYGRSVKTINDENRIKYLRREIAELQKKVDKEKEKTKKSSLSSLSTKGSAATNNVLSSSGSHMVISNLSSAASDFPLSTKFIFDVSKSAYMLTVEVQCPIDLVLIRCQVALEVVESDIGSSVISITPSHLLEPASQGDFPCKFLAAFRCQGSERRLSVGLRPREGEQGDVLLTVVTNAKDKSAKVAKFTLRPLSLHYRVHEFSEEERRRERNSVKFTG